MRLSSAITFAALVVGSAAAGCPYAERAASPAAAAGCPYAKRAAAAATVPKEKPAVSRRGPVEGKKGIFYSKFSCAFSSTLEQY
jgi:hypothetical protein